MTATTDRPIRSSLGALAWRTRHSHWLAAWLATAAAVAVIPTLELAATGGLTAGWGNLAPFAAVPLTVMAVPKLRRRAAADVRVYREAADLREVWDQWAAEQKNPPRIKRVELVGNDLVVTVAAPRLHDWATAPTIGGITPSIAARPKGATLTYRKDKTAAGPVFPAAWTTEPPHALPDLERIPVARTINGDPAHIQLLYSHVLVVGETGSGKGSVLWQIVASISPGIPSGEIELWGIDPKGGLEFSTGAELFTRTVYGGGDRKARETAEMLEDLCAIQDRRYAGMRGKVRKHQPTPGDPAYVLLVDEVLSLTTTILDPRLRKRVMSALNELLTQGRAPGISLVLASQRPQKAALDFIRDSCPGRVCLGVTEPNHVDMVLGEGARARGAKADQIPSGDQYGGIGYLRRNNGPPVLVRAPWWSDDAIRDLAARYPAPRPEPTTEPPPPAAARSDRRARIEELLDGGDMTAEQIAAAVGCSKRWVNMIRREREGGDPQRGATAPHPPGGSLHGAPAAGPANAGSVPGKCGSPGGNFVPEGDPTSHVNPPPFTGPSGGPEVERLDPLRDVP